MTKKELIELVARICHGNYTSEDHYYRDLNKFMKNVPDPKSSDLIYYHKPRLTPEEIVEKALAYKPIILPPPDDIEMNQKK